MKKENYPFFIDKQTTRDSKPKTTHRFQILDCLHHLQKPFFHHNKHRNKK